MLNKNNMVKENSILESEDTVTLSKQQFAELTARLEKVEQRGLGVVKPKRVTEHTARVRVHEGKPVVWCGNVKEKKDASTGKLVAWMDLKLDGSDKVVMVEYLDFLNAPNHVLANIKSQKMEQFETVLGVRNAINPDEAKINSKNWKSKEVEDRVVTRKYTVTVEILEGDLQGKEFVIPADALNL